MSDDDKNEMWDDLKKEYLTTEQKIELIRKYNSEHVDQSIRDAMEQFIKDNPDAS